MVKVVRYGRAGLSLHAHYTIRMPWTGNPNESAQVAGQRRAGSGRLQPWSTPSNYVAPLGTPWWSMGAMEAAWNGWEDVQRLDGPRESGNLQRNAYTMHTRDRWRRRFHATSGAAIVGWAGK